MGLIGYYFNGSFMNVRVLTYKELDKALWREMLLRIEEAEKRLKVVTVTLATIIREI